MDEYFCPNCGAILNDQAGFDPDNNTWICKECGKLLMDEDTYNGEEYEGVAWFCDQCGALLNKQSGFSDNYDTWKCKECYHLNIISEDEIYESEEDYQKLKMSVDQSDCNNLQKNFYSDDREEEEDNDDDEWDEKDCEDDDCDNEEDIEELNYSTTIYNERDLKKSETRKKNNNELRKKRIKAFLFNRKNIEVGVSSKNLEGEDVGRVKSLLENAAFNNIKIIPIKDIYKDNNYKKCSVEKVLISGHNNFDEKSFFPYDSEVIITYHMKKEIKLPYSYRMLKKSNFHEVSNMLIDLGYTEVKGKELEDLVTGWIKKEGAIENITFGENEIIEKNKMYEYDVNIVISYHTFKKKKNK